MNTPMSISDSHFVKGSPLRGPFDDHLQQAVFGLGCFWGAERHFWQTEGVFSTAAGYAGGTVRTRITGRSAVGKPAMPRSCWSFSIPR